MTGSSFLVCTRNRPSDLRRCIESIMMQSILPLEIVVIDGGDQSSKDWLDEMFESSGIELVYELTAPGRTRQLNMGARVCRGDPVFVVDDDVVLDGRFHEEMLATFDRGGEQVGGVQGTVENDTYSNLPVRVFKTLFLLSRHTKNRRGRVLPSGFYTTPISPTDAREAQALRLCGLGFRSRVFDEFSFDEFLEGYALKEDVDFSYRVSKKYRLLISPRARFRHLKSPGARISIREKSRMHIVNNHRIFLKNLDGTLLQRVAFSWALLGRLVFQLGKTLAREEPGYFLGALEGLSEVVRLAVPRRHRHHAPQGMPAQQDSSQRSKVLFIMGMTRTGSTLLDNVLGQIDGFFSCGDLRLLWKHGMMEHRQCGCGARVLDCEVWSSTLRQAYGDDWNERIDGRQVVRWQRAAVRIYHTWGLLRKRPGRVTGSHSLQSYTSLVARLYQSIADITGARVIVDSSKRPSDAGVLRLCPELDAYFVHLVRDPRAVAFSWRRLRRQPEANAPRSLSRKGPVHTTTRWLYRNFASQAVRAKVGDDHSLFVRYEDFVRDPKKVLSEMVGFVGEEVTSLPLNGSRSVSLGINHTVSGNPSRFQRGEVAIRDDRQWLFDQKALDRITSTVVSLPLLRSYGYAVRPTGTPSE
ncbi:MAG: sulfotransferase [Actinomycetota bacterium]